MAIAAGDFIGPYEILSALGAGGMGEVFKARDTRLDRVVALKVLPAAIANDLVARERFEREARSVAALNHPNICSIYDIGRQGDVHYFVMEFIPGETLAVRLARGPLSVKQATACIGSIAAALDRAHQAGIVHRDVKPGNVMIAKDGCKLLDFGIAKASGLGGTDATTRGSAGALTDRGLIIGTIQYMAPEQIEGSTVDSRADIFSLGAVLYEAVTGQKAFEGNSQASVMAAILQQTPPRVSMLQPVVSPHLDHVVQRCLEKDPDRRWQSARDLMLELEAAADMPIDAAGVKPLRSWRAVIAALLFGVAAGALAWPSFDVRRPAGPQTPTIAQAARLTQEVGFAQSATWAPNGNLFAFASNRTGNFEIYVRRIEGGHDVNVSNHEADDVQPAFSPDGNSVAFISTRSSRSGLIKIGTYIGFDTRTFGGDLWIVPALGGQPRRLVENANSPAWHPNGGSLIFIGGREDQRAIGSIPAAGGPTTWLLPEDESRWEIIRVQYAPSGQWITFETADRVVHAMPARGGKPTELARGSSHVWDPDGKRLYYSNQDMAGGTRIETVEIVGSPVALRAGAISFAGVSTGSLKELSLSSDRTRLLATGTEEGLNLTRIALTANGGGVVGSEEELSSGSVRDRYPVVSPDNTRIALGSNRLGRNDVWLLDLRTREWTRVDLPQTPETWVSQPCWARDGNHLLVMRFQNDATTDYQYVALDGSVIEETVPRTPAVSGKFACQFSGHGDQVVYSVRQGQFDQLFVMDIASKKTRQLTFSPSHKYEAAWSPDDRWISFSANAAVGAQVWRIPSSGGTEEQLTSTSDRMRHLFYSPDGKWLYVQPNHANIWRMPASGGEIQQVTHFLASGLFIEEPSVSPDGKWLVYNKGRGGSSLWMLTLSQRP